MAPSDAQNTTKSCQIHATVNLPFKRPVHAWYIGRAEGQDAEECIIASKRASRMVLRVMHVLRVLVFSASDAAFGCTSCVIRVPYVLFSCRKNGFGLWRRTSRKAAAKKRRRRRTTSPPAATASAAAVAPVPAPVVVVVCPHRRRRPQGVPFWRKTRTSTRTTRRRRIRTRRRGGRHKERRPQEPQS